MSASGIALPVPDARAYVLDHAWERYNRPSMLQHLEQGRRTEIDALLGAVLAAARPHLLACPVAETVLLMVKARELRPPAGTALRVPKGAIGPAQFENIGSVRNVTPSIRTRNVAWPIHVRLGLRVMATLS